MKDPTDLPPHDKGTWPCNCAYMHLPNTQQVCPIHGHPGPISPAVKEMLNEPGIFTMQSTPVDAPLGDGAKERLRELNEEYLPQVNSLCIEFAYHHAEISERDERMRNLIETLRALLKTFEARTGKGRAFDGSMHQCAQDLREVLKETRPPAVDVSSPPMTARACPESQSKDVVTGGTVANWPEESQAESTIKAVQVVENGGFCPNCHQELQYNAETRNWEWAGIAKALQDAKREAETLATSKLKSEAATAALDAGKGEAL